MGSGSSRRAMIRRIFAVSVVEVMPSLSISAFASAVLFIVRFSSSLIYLESKTASAMETLPSRLTSPRMVGVAAAAVTAPKGRNSAPVWIALS